MYSDVGDIDLTGAVSLTGDTTLQADSDANQSGKIVMNTNSLTGNDFNLTLYTGENDTLDGSITGVNLLTLNSSTANNKTFTSTGASFSVSTLQTNEYALFSRSQGTGTSLDPYMIYSVSNAVGGLQYIPTESLSAYYELANNINSAETSSWNSGAGFTPIGNNITPFTGTLNGNNFTISDLFINLPLTRYVGLFGYTLGASIENVGLLNADITGQNRVGTLVGANYNSSIDNSFTTGNVTGTGNNIGGLVGLNYTSSNIDNSYTTSNVVGVNNVGGLVGWNGNSSSIDNSYATGSVNAGSFIGGLVGVNYKTSSITNSYATGSVNGVGYAGGLVGYNSHASIIDNSYASGNVHGGANYVGGLVGYNLISSVIDNSYATGSVSGTNVVGGLVGDNISSSVINNSFATGSVSGGTNVGGLIGADDGTTTLTNNWWYNSLTQGIGNNGSNTSIGQWQEAGSASDFFNQAQAVYNGIDSWDISSTVGHSWAMSGDIDAYPLLQFRYSTTIKDLDQLQLMFLNLGASYSLANDIDATETSNWNAGNGFAPIGISSPFTGTFNGNGFTISNLFINLPTTNDVGLFGYSLGATIENVGLVNANVTGTK